MKLRSKLFFSFITIAILFILITVITVFFILNVYSQGINDIKIRLINHSTLVHQLHVQIMKIQLFFTAISATQEEGLFSSSNNGFKEAEIQYESIKKSLNELQANDKEDEELIQIYQEIQNEMENYYKLGKEMAQTYIDFGPDRGKPKMKVFNESTTKLSTLINRIMEIDTQNQGEIINRLERRIDITLLITIAILFIPFIISIIIALSISSGLTKQVNEILATTDSLSKGDFTIESNIRSKDEIGNLADNLNRSIESLKGVISGVQKTFEKNRETSHQFSNRIARTMTAVSQISASLDLMQEQYKTLMQNIDNSSISVEEIMAAISSLSNQIESQASAVTETSASIEEMNASIENVARITQTRKKATEELKKITQVGGDKVEATNQIISDISKNVDDMLEMISIINNVASQTDLLSMNAAIEAAHAGEAGKGFAVVADEIQKLAESTSNNAKNISTSLKDIIEKINLGLSSSEESGKSFTQISNQVKEVVNTFDEIVSSAEELSHGSREILNAVNSLLKITETIKNGSTEMKCGAEEITQSMMNMKNIGNDYQSKINEINSGTDEIYNGVAEISHLAIRNTEDINTLAENMDKIKIDKNDDKTKRQEEQVSLDFSSARLMHLEWTIMLKNFVKDKIQLSDDIIHLTRNCSLGKWLNTEGITKYNENENIGKLIKIHKLLHDKMEEIIAIKNTGNGEQALKEFKAFNEISKDVLDMLTNIEQEITVL